MSKEDQQRWNAKHAHQRPRQEPSAIVRRFFELARAGNALDIACGTGRNALFLAARGFEVDAVDISSVAIARLAGVHPRVHARQQDLDTFEIASATYDLIINIRFLDRRLFPYMREGLAGGGVLIFETFLESPTAEAQQPSRRDYLLRPNELLHAFLPLHILFYEEAARQTSDAARHLASLVARKPSLTPDDA